MQADGSNPELSAIKELVDSYLVNSVSEETRLLIARLVQELNL
jgi:hypothetical protein